MSMKNVVITYKDGSRDQYYLEYVGQPQNGVLVLVDIDGKRGHIRHIPLESIKHYEVTG